VKVRGPCIRRLRVGPIKEKRTKRREGWTTKGRRGRKRCEEKVKARRGEKRGRNKRRGGKNGQGIFVNPGVEHKGLN